MKKKAISIVLVFTMIATMFAAFSVTASAKATGEKRVSLALDWDELASYVDANGEDTRTGDDVSAELKDDLKVQSQAYHKIYTVSIGYWDATKHYQKVGSKAIDSTTQYYIELTIEFPKRSKNDPVYNLDGLRFNGKELTAITTGKPQSGQYLKGQVTTIEEHPALVLYIPVDFAPKYVAAAPYLAEDTFEYTGSEIKPEIKNMNDEIMYTDNEEGTSGATDVGDYQIVIKLNDKSAYRFGQSANEEDGNIVLNYSINPTATKITKLSKGSKSFTVKWEKKTDQVDGYVIRYSTKSSMGNAKEVYVKKNTTTSRTIKKLKSKKTYYVQVRTYCGWDETNYSTWSEVKKVKTK